MFRDRMEAGSLLAGKLKKFYDQNGLVLAVPRGGIPVAYVVAKELGFPLDIILTKKIGHPVNREYAIGAVSLTDHFVVPHEQVSEKYISKEIKKIRKRLMEMQQGFLGGKKPEPVKGKTVIIIDDGIATGNTLLSTVHMLRKSNPAKIVVAAPVASSDAVKKLAAEADEVVVVLIPEAFYGVGAFYEDFHQVSDEEVMYYLDLFKNEIKRTA
ncbi:MAG TPA: phosphoribosyltransferase [Chitinophagaceae bacterium]|nr:phosphoribosyltransferase [Chitinophagaceae bacterium]